LDLKAGPRLPRTRTSRRGGDLIRYSIDVGTSNGPFTVTARLYYQPIGYRWAKNLSVRETFEGKRFLRYGDEMASGSAAVLARVEATARQRRV